MPILPDEQTRQIDASLMAHVARLDLLIQHEVHCVNVDPNDRLGLAGVLVDADAVCDAFSQPFDLPYWASVPSEIPELANMPEVKGRLARLQTSFNLSDVERDAVLFSVLPFFDPRYTALYAYIQPYKANLEWPTTDLVLRLLGFHGTQKVEAKSLLGPSSAIFNRGLVKCAHGWTATDANCAMQGVAAVFHFLIGDAPYASEPGAKWQRAEKRGEYGEYADRLTNALCKVSEQWPLVLLNGNVKDDPVRCVADLAGRLGHPTLHIRPADLPEDDGEAASLMRALARDACLWNACVLLEADALAAAPRAAGSSAEGELSASRPRLKMIGAAVFSHPGPVVLYSRGETTLFQMSEHRPHICIHMPERTFEEDFSAAKQILSGSTASSEINDQVLHDLILRYRPDSNTFARALKEADAHRQCDLGQPQQTVPLATYLRRALNLRARNDFGKLAHRSTPRRAISDLVLAPHARLQMQEVAAAIRHRDEALARGFADKLGRHTGISVLFHGPSGTGKSMAAEVLAYELGVDLIRVDLSTVVNKFIGETEKNLSRIFDLAAADAGVLFFDEADALFGKRTETKDAHDRHANIEVSYLLQRVESHPGLVVLSTNFREHLDDAFTRRLTFDIEFPFPDVETRERLWSQVFPESFVLADGVSPSLLARRAEVAGGNIRNIALLASWLMLSEGEQLVKWSHIDRAMKREFAKMGRTWYAH